MNTENDSHNVSETSRPVRVLIGKPGLDGHDRGAKVVARALRDAGMEVIYTGLRQTPEAIVQTAIEEDVDVVGLSILSDAHDTLVPEVIELLEDYGMDDVLVLAGGTIPEEDREKLYETGLDMAFGPGTDFDTITEYIENNVGG